MTDDQAIPALSVKQPWAKYILSGRKSMELRTFLPGYTGDIWLHTGRVPDADAMRTYSESGLFLGGYIGIIRIVSAVPLDETRWVQWRDKHLDQGDFKPGYFAWLLEKPRRFLQPILGHGNVKLFYPSADVLAELSASVPVDP